MYTFVYIYSYTLHNMKTASFPVALLQGRLSPDVENRYQFFPTSDWQAEFTQAKEIGFDGIEWLIDPKEWEHNPIFPNEDTHGEVLAQAQVLPITSVCAEWFMAVCIWEGDLESHRERIRSLFPVLEQTVNKLLLVPLLETHNIRPVAIQKKIVEVLKPLAPELEARGISIGFETELTAYELIQFLKLFESDAFGVYYDIGNCTSYGFNCSEDVRILGTRIKGIHVKDRKVHTTQALPLGKGDADYKGVFEALTEIGWKGTLVMQAWRGENYLDDARAQLHFVRSFFDKE